GEGGGLSQQNAHRPEICRSEPTRWGRQAPALRPTNDRPGSRTVPPHSCFRSLWHWPAALVDIGRDSRLMIFVIFSTVPSVGRQLAACVPAWPFARRAPSRAPFRRARSPRL